jgi:methylase of polypeptide subunit release factors
MRQFLDAAPRCIRAGSVILLEIGAYQGDAVTAIVQQSFPRAKISIEPDYAGLDRLAVIEVM